MSILTSEDEKDLHMEDLQTKDFRSVGLGLRNIKEEEALYYAQQCIMS